MLTKGDVHSDGGCLRRWWYRYVERRPEPSTGSQNRGTQIHKEIERYYADGNKELSDVAIAMLAHLPAPGPNVLVEHRIGGFEVAGIQACGDVDYVHLIDQDTVEILDSKTTSSISKWAKTPEQLADNIQMLLYGFWAYLKYMPKTIRLSHVYGQTKGAAVAKKVSIDLSREEISERFWNRVESAALKCIDTATQAKAEDSEGNPDACSAYGGCPYRGVCEVGKRSALDKLFGKPSGGTVGLLDRINAKPEVEAEKRRLVAEEAAAKAPPGFADAVERIKGAGKGFPALGGDAAKAWAVLNGEPPAAGYAGSGFLGGLTVMTVADVLQLSDELLEEGMKETPPSIVPPDAPPSIHPVPEGEMQKRKRGRPPKAKAENAPITPPDRPTVEEVKQIEEKILETAGPEVDLGYTEDGNTSGDLLFGLCLFADCVPSVPFTPLEPYIDRLCRELCEAHGCADVRCGEERGAIGFGKWKGALAAKAKDTPPPRGVYTVDTRSEIAFEVVAALRSIKGTFYVRSTR